MASLPETITNSWTIQWGWNVKPNLGRVLIKLQTEIQIKHGDEIRRPSLGNKQQDLSINGEI